MRLKIPPYVPDPQRTWHRWYAWHPVTANTNGYNNDHFGPRSDPTEHIVWLEPVMRRYIVAGSDKIWQYELCK